ncbi:PepSY domain-containing protein [Ornithinimicrobium pratense]|nr:PepSY domain-containing protein [Ornithinimicrobium pratense]
MTTSKTTALSASLALALALSLGGCSSDAAETPTPPAVQDSAGDDSATQETGDESATQETGEAGTTVAPAEATPDGSDGDVTGQALQAVQVAEAEAGGTAYEIDDQQDDGSWEIDVAVDDRSVEVTVGHDGTVVETEDDDLDDDDRAGLDAATITMSEAIELAVAEVGGHLDDAELEEDDGTHYWEVSLGGTDRGDDVEVKVSMTGEVLEIDD